MTEYTDEERKLLIIFFKEVNEQMMLNKKYIQDCKQYNLFWTNITDAKAYIDQLLNSMAYALLVTNVKEIIKQVNPAVQHLFGYGKDELLGQSISLIIPAEDVLQQIKDQGIFCQEQSSLSESEEKRENNIEVNCRTKTGEKIAVAFSGSMFYTEMTELQNYIYIGRNITLRQSMEAELKQANENLTQSVKKLQQRNREITGLSQLTHRLQGCMTLEEAYETIAQMVPPIFPDSMGGILLSNQSDQQPLQIVAYWGEFPIATLENLSIHDCAAWQSGSRYLACDRLLCSWRQHSEGDLSTDEYCCIPMVVQGETIGLLCLSLPSLAAMTQEKQELAMTLGEHIALALGNLKLRETLKNQSSRDPLTGLFNRRYLEEFAEREMPKYSQEQKSMGMIFLDIDYFKQFNDTFGHQAGDIVLQAVSKLLIRSIRNLDLACRYGGEEFIIILLGTDVEVTQSRAEQIRSAMKLLRLEYEGQSLGSITSSFGVACFPEHGQTLAQLVSAADQALYRAKELGRDRVVIAS